MGNHIQDFQKAMKVGISHDDMTEHQELLDRISEWGSKHRKAFDAYLNEQGIEEEDLEGRDVLQLREDLEAMKSQKLDEVVGGRTGPQDGSGPDGSTPECPVASKGQVPLYDKGGKVVGYVSKSTTSVGAAKKMGSRSAKYTTRGSEGAGWVPVTESKKLWVREAEEKVVGMVPYDPYAIRWRDDDMLGKVPQYFHDGQLWDLDHRVEPDLIRDEAGVYKVELYTLGHGRYADVLHPGEIEESKVNEAPVQTPRDTIEEPSDPWAAIDREVPMDRPSPFDPNVRRTPKDKLKVAKEIIAKYKGTITREPDVKPGKDAQPMDVDFKDPTQALNATLELLNLGIDSVTNGNKMTSYMESTERVTNVVPVRPEGKKRAEMYLQAKKGQYIDFYEGDDEQRVTIGNRVTWKGRQWIVYDFDYEWDEKRGPVNVLFTLISPGIEAYAVDVSPQDIMESTEARRDRPPFVREGSGDLSVTLSNGEVIDGTGAYWSYLSRDGEYVHINNADPRGWIGLFKWPLEDGRYIVGTFEDDIHHDGYLSLWGDGAPDVAEPPQIFDTEAEAQAYASEIEDQYGDYDRAREEITEAPSRVREGREPVRTIPAQNLSRGDTFVVMDGEYEGQRGEVYSSKLSRAGRLVMMDFPGGKSGNAMLGLNTRVQVVRESKGTTGRRVREQEFEWVGVPASQLHREDILQIHDDEVEVTQVDSRPNGYVKVTYVYDDGTPETRMWPGTKVLQAKDFDLVRESRLKDDLPILGADGQGSIPSPFDLAAPVLVVYLDEDTGTLEDVDSFGKFLARVDGIRREPVYGVTRKAELADEYIQDIEAGDTDLQPFFHDEDEYVFIHQAEGDDGYLPEITEPMTLRDYYETFVGAESAPYPSDLLGIFKTREAADRWTSGEMVEAAGDEQVVTFDSGSPSVFNWSTKKGRLEALFAEAEKIAAAYPSVQVSHVMNDVDRFMIVGDAADVAEVMVTLRPLAKKQSVNVQESRKNRRATNRQRRRTR